MKTTKANFAIFKREVKRLLKLFGLVGWEYNIWHMDIPEGELANTHAEIPERLFIITLNKKWANTITNEKLKEIALHEVLEVLFWKIESFTGKAYKEEAREEVHSLIQTIINVMRG